MFRITFISLFASVTASAFSGPSDELTALPCRPTIACTADITPPGAVELEVGYLYRRLNGPVNQQTVPFLLKLSLAEWVQLQVSSNGATFADSPSSIRYHDDVIVGFKLHLGGSADVRPSFALSAALSVPVAHVDGFEHTYDALFTAYGSREYGPVHVDLNVGVNLWRLEAALLPQAWLALAASVDLSHHFTVMAENYGFTNAAPIAIVDAGFLFAVSYAPKSWLVLDVGADVGLITSVRNVSAFVGMTVIPFAIWENRKRTRQPPAALAPGLSITRGRLAD